MKNFCELCQCYIKESTIFSDLSESQLSELKGSVKTMSFSKKTFIFHEGDPCRGFYVVKKGRIKLLRISRDGKEQIIRIINSGGILGLEVFYNAGEYSTTAIAMDESELCFINRASFEDMLESYPAIGRKMVKALSRELEAAYERIGILGLMTARQRLAHLLYNIAKDESGSEEGIVKMRLPLSRLEIAEVLGITQETSIRLLRSLKEEGLIYLKGKEILIPSLAKLRALGEA